MNTKLILLAGAIFGFLGVLFGAFGAHALKAKLSGDLFNVFEVGVRYQFYHALALIAVSWASTEYPHHLVLASGFFFILGIIIFSGSLYLLALTGVRGFGALAPIGGLSLMAAWLMLFSGVLKS